MNGDGTAGRAMDASENNGDRWQKGSKLTKEGKNGDAEGKAGNHFKKDASQAQWCMSISSTQVTEAGRV